MAPLLKESLCSGLLQPNNIFENTFENIFENTFEKYLLEIF